MHQKRVLKNHTLLNIINDNCHTPPGGSSRRPWNPNVSNANGSRVVGDGHRVLLDFRHPDNREGPRRSVNPAPVVITAGAKNSRFFFFKRSSSLKGKTSMCRNTLSMWCLIEKWYSSHVESYCIYRYQNTPYSIYRDILYVGMYRRISVDPNTPNICWMIVQVQNGKIWKNSFSKGHCHPRNLAPLYIRLKWLYSISPAALFAWLNPSICNHRASSGCFYDYTRRTSTVFFSTDWSTWLCIFVCPLPMPQHDPHIPRQVPHRVLLAFEDSRLLFHHFIELPQMVSP